MLTANSGVNRPRLLVYKLDAKEVLPSQATAAVQRPEPPPAPDDAATLTQGKLLYQANCVTCHGDSAQGNHVLPDLRFSAMLEPAAWQSVVLKGALAKNGMIGFEKFLGTAEIEAIRAYVISEARKELAAP
jgi:quinohemoprotein ethanol dehydrogenase